MIHRNHRIVRNINGERLRRDGVIDLEVFRLQCHSADEMLLALSQSGYGDSEAFYRVAQAISETLPIESREKKLLDGFLAGRERVRGEMRQGRFL